MVSGMVSGSRNINGTKESGNRDMKEDTEIEEFTNDCENCPWYHEDEYIRCMADAWTLIHKGCVD